MRRRASQSSFAGRVNRILNYILIGLCLLMVRCWHLAVVQHDARVAEAARPKRKTVWVHPKRGVIRDRHGHLLALNQPNLRVGILYSAIRDVPRVATVIQGEKRLRLRTRSQYITKLSEELAQILQLDARRIEDVIHSKAALFPHLPQVIQEQLPLEQYARLKMLEKDWVGLVVEAVPERFYPTGPVAAHVVGHMGKLSAEEFHRWQHRLQLLDQALDGQEEARHQLTEEGIFPDELAEERLAWRRLGYVPADWCGKSGIEKSYESELRGLCGVEVFEADTSGRRLRELAPQVPMQPGADLTLSISLPLQEYAEKLLADAEGRLSHPHAPPIKGGGIVVMDPRTGEVLALAGYPTYDPNLFIQRDEEVAALLENETWLGKVWDGHTLIHLRSEEGRARLSWDGYLQATLGKEHALSKFCQKVTLGEASAMLRHLPQGRSPTDVELQECVGDVGGFPSERPLRLLGLDLLRLGSEGMLDVPAAAAAFPLRAVRQYSQDLQVLRKTLREAARRHFSQVYFLPWRESSSKQWLQRQRKEEHRAHRPHRPYLDLLDQEESRQFQAWWGEQEWVTLMALLGAPEGVLAWEPAQELLACSQELEHLRALQRRLLQDTPAFLRGLRGYQDLRQPLLGRYPYLRGGGRGQTLKELASAFHPPFGLGFLRSQAYQQVAPMGSIFKLVTAFEALRQSEERYGHPRYQEWSIVEKLVSDGRHVEVGKFADGRPIPKIYQGGRLPLTVYRHFGAMDLLSALERSSNPYFSLLTVEAMRSPEDLADAARLFGLSQRTGIRLAGESPGRLPADLETNRSGLYAFAIGQHEMRCTPLQTACLVSAFANGGKLQIPVIELHREHPQERRTIPLSSEIKQLIMQGMRRVIAGPTGTARPGLVKRDPISAEARACYERMAPFMIAKTGTAQILETLSPDPIGGVQMVNHVSFAGIFYPTPEAAAAFKSPELVVVVSLRFAHGGREAAPLAAQMAERWRKIREKFQ